MTRLLTAWGLGLGLLAAGCSSDHRVDFRIVSDAPTAVEVSSELIDVPAGTAIGVKAFAVVDDERKDELVELFPKRPNIVGIEPGLEERTWVIWGVEPGSTAVELYFDGDFVGEMPAVCSDPE